MAETRIDRRLDLRGVACPMNFVRTKLALDELETGQVLEVFLDEGEPIDNVSRSLQDEGQQLLEKTPTQPGYRLVVKKVGG